MVKGSNFVAQLVLKDRAWSKALMVVPFFPSALQAIPEGSCTN